MAGGAWIGILWEKPQPGSGEERAWRQGRVLASSPVAAVRGQ